MPDDLLALLSQLARERAPQPEETGDTQARIVKAALELFSERSYEAATTQAIAKRAGVTEKTLFRHFGSKENLFTKTVYPALFKLLQPYAVDELRKLIESTEADFATTVRAIVTDRVNFALKHPTILKMVVQEMLLRPEFREAIAAFFQATMWPHLEAFFERARARGELRDVPSATAFRTLLSQIGGYVLTRSVMFPQLEWNTERDIDELTTIILNGLAPAS